MSNQLQVRWASCAFLVSFVALGCSSASGDTGDDAGAGGTATVTGGATSTGAVSSTGATSGSGGAASGGVSSGGAGTGGESASGGTTGGSGETGGTGGTVDEPRTRVIGYLPNWYESYSSWATKVDFAKVTHLNLAFALGDSDGDLQLAPNNEVDALVTAAHAAGVKVFPSLCGGGGDGKITPHYQPGQVDSFVDKIVSYAEARNMDGIDVDVEAPDKMGATYDTFIAKLIAKAHAKGLEVTAAVAPWMQWGMSDQTVRSFDFITIMSYDNAGTWTGAGAHSSYEQAVDALEFYENKGVDKDKMVLGVPFYGYCWGNCNGKDKDYVLYKNILNRFSWASTTDWIDQDGAKLSFNGVDTMKAKAQLGKQYGGVMIWELAGDVPTSDERSLLRAIDDAL